MFTSIIFTIANILLIFNMADNTGDNTQAKGAQLNRVHLHRVMIDTPALLNMVKHCRDSDWRQGG